MKNIEFLPARYRENNAARADVVRRWTLLLLLVTVIAPLAAYQFISHRRVMLKFAEIDPQYNETQAELKRLGQLQQELALARCEAGLLVYLGHPWPKTQILSQVREPLPEAVRITSVHLQEMPKTIAGATVPMGRNRAARRSSEVSDTKVDELRPPAERDLAALVDHLRQHETIVILSGVTVDNTDLHTYVAKLRISGLFAKSELKSLESLPGNDNSKSQKFEIRLVLSPGYGLPKKERALVEAEAAAQASNSAITPGVGLANKP